MEWKHAKPSRDAATGTAYPATNIVFRFAVNPSAGIMLIFKQSTPASEPSRVAKNVVPLRRFQDVAWLAWLKKCSDFHVSPAGLYYRVDDARTLDTIEKVTGRTRSVGWPSILASCSLDRGWR